MGKFGKEESFGKVCHIWLVYNGLLKIKKLDTLYAQPRFQEVYKPSKFDFHCLKSRTQLFKNAGKYFFKWWDTSYWFSRIQSTLVKPSHCLQLFIMFFSVIETLKLFENNKILIYFYAIIKNYKTIIKIISMQFIKK